MGKKHKQSTPTKSWRKEGKSWVYKQPEDLEEKYKDHPRLYAAYGSNLNVLQMHDRCATAMPVTGGLLHDYALRFSSVCTIEKQEGSSCPIAIWSVEPADIAALDRYEGYPTLYGKRDLTVTILGKQEKAFTYVLNPPYDIEPPWQNYFECVEEGYTDWQINDAPLYDALDHSYEHYTPVSKGAYTIASGYEDDAYWRSGRDNPGWWDDYDQHWFDSMDSESKYHECCLCSELEIEDLMINIDEETDTWLCCDCDFDIYAEAYPEEPDLVSVVKTRQWWQEAEDVAYSAPMDADDPGDQDNSFDPSELDYSPHVWRNDLQRVDYDHYFDY